MDMIHNILDFFIDIILFILNILYTLICYVGRWVERVTNKTFDGMERIFDLVFETIPNKISLCYRLQRIFYPYKCECDLDLETFPTEVKCWLDDSIGKYRWKIIKRSVALYEPKRYLCFRRKTDITAFKLRWL